MTVNTRTCCNGFALGVTLASTGLNLALHAWTTAAICALLVAAIGALDAIGTAVLRRLDAQIAWFHAERGRTEATAALLQRATSSSLTITGEPERVQ